VPRPRTWLACCLALAAVPVVAAAQGKRQAIALSDTMGSFPFVDANGSVDQPITVWYYRPPRRRPEARVLFVMHGGSRTAEAARDIGAVYGRRHDVIVLAPEFSEQYYPGDSYAFGNMVDSAGRLLPERRWALSAIEHLFDQIRQAEHLTTPTYDIVGHSAGGQFVHRLLLFVPNARFRRAVASSPGRYALPSLTAPFPYGLRGTVIDSAALAHALSRDFVLLLGDRDTEDRAREPEAMSQGRNRFARGLRFFAAATDAASALGTPLVWRLVILPGADHTPGPMVRAGLQELLR
jgi:poly(3-hydroxybutyrate) depolymerase